MRGVRTVIKPIPKAVEAILYQVLRCSKVKPRINYKPINHLLLKSALVIRTLVNDALEADDGEQTTGHSRARNQNQNNNSEQASRVPAADLLYELV